MDLQTHWGCEDWEQDSWIAAPVLSWLFPEHIGISWSSDLTESDTLNIFFYVFFNSELRRLQYSTKGSQRMHYCTWTRNVSLFVQVQFQLLSKISYTLVLTCLFTVNILSTSITVELQRHIKGEFADSTFKFANVHLMYSRRLVAFKTIWK